MLTLTDVTADPTVRERSRLPQAWLDEATRLGFEHVGWACSMPATVPPETDVDEMLVISAVFADRARRSFLELTRARLVDDRSVRTVFDDGTILSTNTKPSARRWWLYRWGLEHTPARHRYRLSFVDATSLAELVTLHLARVREEEARGGRVFANGELRTYLATRRRWREIADARMKRQQSIASAIGFATVMLAAIGVGLVGKLFAPSLGEAAGVVSFVGMLLTLPLGFGAFLFSLYFVAPILARGAPAPPPRPARELLALADAVRRGELPRRSTKEEEGIALSLSPTALARAQRIDLVATTASAVVLPVAGLLSLAALGAGGTWVALGAVFSIDGVVAIVMKKTRADLLRERLVPELARASEACASPGACSKLSPYVMVALGVLSLVAARAALAQPRQPVSLTTVVEWCAVLAWFVILTISRTKKRHRRLASAG
ncbi:MAG: hypothetical protein KF819_16185 [Labilithrix sp.]|nr:hypothetical protein [Labilithrix sp.]